MAKELIPHKMVIEFNPDGTERSSVMIYKIKEDGVTREQFYSVGVSAGLKKEEINSVLAAAKAHAEGAEKIVKGG